MTFRDGLLPSLDAIRSIPGNLGLRLIPVTVRVRQWTGQRVGLGTVTVTDTRLLVDGQNPRVVQLKTEDIVRSAGKYSSGDWRIGPVTPLPGMLDDVEPASASSREVLYVLNVNGAEVICKKVNDNSFSPFRIVVVVRPIGQ